MRSLRPVCAILSALLTAGFTDAATQSGTKVTIITDAFGASSSASHDWGFSALIEHEGRRILFDTGNNPELFAQNSSFLGIDLTQLDFVVVSHRHGDHTGGLHHLLAINPRVIVYAPNDEYFGGQIPAGFFGQAVPALPPHMRYFGADVPSSIPHSSPWRHANIVRVESIVEIAPGIRVIRNLSRTALFGETPEVSLVIDTPEGPLLFVGCSHPGIEEILQSIGARETGVRLLLGGLHLTATTETEITRLVNALQNEWMVQEVAPGHCTGELAFDALHRSFGRRYIYAGVGTVIELP
jgi:7,8-dihydropterin-6-yl-methyl-4-(beta-D-ribofuranosyl)aminobenzene 5'-phosphate synthase